VNHIDNQFDVQLEMLKKKHILYAADVCLLHTGKEEKTDYRFSL